MQGTGKENWGVILRHAPPTTPIREALMGDRIPEALLHVPGGAVKAKSIDWDIACTFDVAT
jgi:hypothetical protein